MNQIIRGATMCLGTIIMFLAFIGISLSVMGSMNQPLLSPIVRLSGALTGMAGISVSIYLLVDILKDQGSWWKRPWPKKPKA